MGEHSPPHKNLSPLESRLVIFCYISFPLPNILTNQLCPTLTIFRNEGLTKTHYWQRKVQKERQSCLTILFRLHYDREPRSSACLAMGGSVSFPCTPSCTSCFDIDMLLESLTILKKSYVVYTAWLVVRKDWLLFVVGIKSIRNLAKWYFLLGTDYCLPSFARQPFVAVTLHALFLRYVRHWNWSLLWSTQMF